jgi:hypothetical protein
MNRLKSAALGAPPLLDTPSVHSDAVRDPVKERERAGGRVVGCIQVSG